MNKNTPLFNLLTGKLSGNATPPSDEKVTVAQILDDDTVCRLYADLPHRADIRATWEQPVLPMRQHQVDYFSDFKERYKLDEFILIDSLSPLTQLGLKVQGGLKRGELAMVSSPGKIRQSSLYGTFGGHAYKPPVDNSEPPFALKMTPLRRLRQLQAMQQYSTTFIREGGRQTGKTRYGKNWMDYTRLKTVIQNLC